VGERILIAGAGYVGSALAARLAADGHAVFGLRRRPAGLPAGVTPLAADLCDPASLRALPEALDAVVYTAAAGGGGEAAYRAAYVDGVRNLLDALAARPHPPRRFLFSSSTAVYGQTGGEWVDETSPTGPADFRGRVLLEGEALLAAGPIPASVLRFGGIYGPGRTRLLDAVRAGTVALAPGGPHYTNRIHRDDCAGALRHLLGLAAPAALYLGVDDEPADRAEVLRWLAARLGAPDPRVDPAAARDPGARGGNKRCSNARLHASGYRLAYPSFREGYSALIADREAEAGRAPGDASR
jgi:nucleoside-diphosphate-sugar epimerase